MLYVANSGNWMHYKPLHSLNGTILAMNSPSGLIFQLVLIYIGPGNPTILYCLLPSVSRLEMFDEFEEWHLIQAHYCFVAAVNDGETLSGAKFLEEFTDRNSTTEVVSSISTGPIVS